MNLERQLKTWIEDDDYRMDALISAARLNLPDWYLAAGFVRNLVWDKLHNYRVATRLADIDLVYFDADNVSQTKDREIELVLGAQNGFPWSAKNQARMHTRNNDAPYISTLDAMSYWVEIQTAVGVCLNRHNQLAFIAPFGLQPLFDLTLTMNPHRPKLQDFTARVKNKNWLRTWPKLKVSS